MQNRVIKQLQKCKYSLHNKNPDSGVKLPRQLLIRLKESGLGVKRDETRVATTTTASGGGRAAPPQTGVVSANTDYRL